mmetsp:Transcript_26436/g.40949  ORF Transcript_26436/g.40949 Transcript_26436/m.40949 type:complete len:440 (-) Transcript_26436:216-1535(-)
MRHVNAALLLLSCIQFNVLKLSAGAMNNNIIVSASGSTSQRRSRRSTTHQVLPHSFRMSQLASTVPHHQQQHDALSSNSVTKSSALSSSDDGSEGEGGNPIVQLATFVRDSFARFVNGTKELYANHQTCNAIRSKQKTSVKITFEEFEFLRKGKEDRSKVANILFLMIFSSSVLPYALMMFPNMLPVPFQPRDDTLTKYHTLSRVRTHAVMETMLAIENAAIIPPISSKLNPFSGKAVRREMARMTDFCGNANLFFQATTPAQILELLGSTLQFPVGENVQKEVNQQTKLMTVPKQIIKGLGKSTGISNSPIMPTFMVRGKLTEYLKSLSESDKFLVEEKVDLNSINDNVLLEACTLRFIGTPDSSPDELRRGLAIWLQHAVVRPGVQQNYNENLGRVALLCYNAIQGARDGRSESQLPRLMFQAPMMMSYASAIDERS